jgi:hypothetical protein
MHKSKDNANKVDPEGTYTPSLINCYWYFSSCEHLYFRVVQNWVGPVVFFRWPWHAEAANIPHTPMYFPLATWSCVVMEPLLHILHCVTHGTWEFCRLTRTWPFPQVRLHWPRISVASTAEADSLGSGFPHRSAWRPQTSNAQHWSHTGWAQPPPARLQWTLVILLHGQDPIISRPKLRTTTCVPVNLVQQRTGKQGKFWSL